MSFSYIPPLLVEQTTRFHGARTSDSWSEPPLLMSPISEPIRRPAGCIFSVLPINRCLSSWGGRKTMIWIITDQNILVSNRTIVTINWRGRNVDPSNKCWYYGMEGGDQFVFQQQQKYDNNSIMFQCIFNEECGIMFDWYYRCWISDLCPPSRGVTLLSVLCVRHEPKRFRDSGSELFCSTVNISSEKLQQINFLCLLVRVEVWELCVLFVWHV